MVNEYVNLCPHFGPPMPEIEQGLTGPFLLTDQTGVGHQSSFIVYDHISIYVHLNIPQEA